MWTETLIISHLPLRSEVRTHASAVSPWLCLAGDGFASYPLAATVCAKFLPLRFTHSSRKQETRPVTVLRCAAALRVQRANTPALDQPSRPR